MNNFDILEALNNVDDECLVNAKINSDVKGKGFRRLKWIGMAACFMLVLLVCILPMVDFSDSPGYQPMLALTVYAADGTENSMILDHSFLNSGISGENIFGKEVPTFEFYVAPVEHGAFDQYDIEISYTGKAVGDKDEHIRLLYVVPAQGIEGVGRYCIVGWFEEETDITVSLKDRESGEIVETMIVNVLYSEADEAYRMTLVYLYTIEGIDPDKLIYHGEETKSPYLY